MGYDRCLEAAGTPVLAYYTTGDYQGTWVAYTADGFYHGSYGSCSGCDWREADISAANISWELSDEARKARIHEIDAGIGREILKGGASSLDEIIATANKSCFDNIEEFEKWAKDCTEGIYAS